MPRHVAPFVRRNCRLMSALVSLKSAGSACVTVASFGGSIYFVFSCYLVAIHVAGYRIRKVGYTAQAAPSEERWTGRCFPVSCRLFGEQRVDGVHMSRASPSAWPLRLRCAPSIWHVGPCEIFFDSHAPTNERAVDVPVQHVVLLSGVRRSCPLLQNARRSATPGNE